ncbi:MAG TPA: rod shape-determining protein MreC [Clostridia bacterium]|nr:rod shape-determining protein MreC [Clostridia bacterium]
MARFYRKPIFIILLILLVGGLTLVRFTAQERTSTTLIEQSVNALFSPLQRGVTFVQNKLEETFSFFGRIISLKKENEQLKAENERLKAANNRLRQLEEENWRLRKLLFMAENVEHKMVPAKVIARDPSNWFSQIVINKGRREGIGSNMAVVTNEGIVGRVIEVTNDSAKVMLITDNGSSIGIRSRRTRDLGVAKGQGEQSKFLLLDYLALESDVRPGDVFVSSGLGGVIPEGIVVGSVTEVEEGYLGLTKRAKLEPAVDFSKLEEVFVIIDPVTNSE